ncbi:MAG TPA: sigma-70 family RNA polymerase sigma factor [Polyangia bacterium]|jgi:RNA polymerase sigma-70 factor (ECF subfamily)|nr:sigma-70 family RNA polymerase sigma factor [Polyangia bacterium]
MLAASRIRRVTGSDTSDEAVSIETLYRAHARRVFRWAQRLGGPAIDHDDVLQEVFIIVNRRLPDLRQESALTSWLFRITAGVVSNHRRSWRRRRFRSAALSPAVLDRAVAAAPGPAELLEQREASQRFYRVLDHLSENYRAVLVLFELDEMATEEIAGLMDRPPATVRVWLHRARAAFSKHWRRDVDREQQPARGEPAAKGDGGLP